VKNIPVLRDTKGGGERGMLKESAAGLKKKKGDLKGRDKRNKPEPGEKKRWLRGGKKGLFL